MDGDITPAIASQTPQNNDSAADTTSNVHPRHNKQRASQTQQATCIPDTTSNVHPRHNKQRASQTQQATCIPETTSNVHPRHNKQRASQTQQATCIPDTTSNVHPRHNKQCASQKQQATCIPDTTSNVHPRHNKQRASQTQQATCIPETTSNVHPSVRSSQTYNYIYQIWVNEKGQWTGYAGRTLPGTASTLLETVKHQTTLLADLSRCTVQRPIYKQLETNSWLKRKHI